VITTRHTLPDGTAVLVKHAGSPEALVRLRHEQRVLTRLAGVPGVPQRVDPLPVDQQSASAQRAEAQGSVGSLPGEPLMCLDRGGVPLREARGPGAPAMPASELLTLASQLAHILAAVHRRGVQHRHVHPGHIVLTGSQAVPMLVGFELASTSAQEQPGFTHHSLVAGTLAYCAPEQTGRGGQSVDHRADLYALGATLYELATGRPPFVVADPLSLIHHHLAVRPVPPIELAPQLPQGLSDVILHLLEKSPDRRYQSAQGLALDLAELIAHQAGPTPIPPSACGPFLPFVPGLHDFPDWLVAPSQPVGRDAELALLAASLDTALLGHRRGVLVAGAPGVGKTALINTLRPLVTARRGWFVSGKFDQLRQDQDTDAMRQALRALGRLLLAEPDAELATQRARILQALGPNAALLASVVPELAVLLGQTKLDAPSGDVLLTESQLVQAVVDLLRATVSPERPLVMVIDDLQWAAAPALRTFDAILNDRQLSGLLLVGAYRANEVSATHPLQARLQRWAQQDAPPAVLTLDNLPPADLGAMLGCMLRLPEAQALALSQAVSARTQGNPFDTVELVNALRREGVLSPGEQGWQWDARAIQRHVGQGEVIGLLQARLAKLPDEAQALMATMACLGGEVSLDLLQAASGLTASQTDHCAAPALDEGLLVMVDDGVRAMRFRHDRVQQATYACMDGQQAAGRHLALARRLILCEPFAAVAAEQYLQATELVSELAERRMVARLFHTAAERLRLVSQGMVERFMAAAIALLQAGHGDAARRAAQGTFSEADQPLLVALATARHLALYNLGRLDEADEAFQFVGRCSRDPLDLVDATCLQIASLTHRARGREAVDLGMALLAQLGTELPADAAASIEQGLSELAHGALSTHTADDASMPEVRDARVVSVAKLLDRLVIPTLQCDPQVNAWLAVESRRLWAHHGPCPALVRSAALSMPLVLVARRQAYREAHALARYTLAVGEARGYDVATATARHVYAIATQHWYSPVEDSVAQAHEAHEALLRGGDLQFACLTYHATAPALFDTAASLQACADEVDAGLGFAQRTGNQFALGLYSTYRQLVRSLRQPPAAGQALGSFHDDAFDEAARHSGRLAVGTMGVVYRVLRALSAALFGDTAQLSAHIAAAMPMLGAIPGFYPMAWAHALQALSMAEQLRAQPGTDDTAPALATLDASLAWLTQRATDMPLNYLHLQHWIEAERASALGDELQALRRFEAAMAAVAPKARPWHQALITERAALCHLAMGLPSTGQPLLAQALRGYEAWGAASKVAQLWRQHPWLKRVEAAHAAPAPTPPQGPAEPQAMAMPGHTIDLMAVVRASQVLSSETSLAQLTARVSELMAAMTGATGVQLVMRRDDAGGWQMPGSTLSLQEACRAQQLPMSAFRYVERTRQALVVADATRDDRFASEPGLAGLPCCSLLVLPIQSQGELKAMLLLENRLSAGCFDPDGLETLQLVAAQLAVSLDNATVYAELEARVQQRTHELRQAQASLVDTARRAGMAEIATNVLHNVGNVLNSVNLSADLIGGKLRATKASGFGRAVQLINEHEADLGAFFSVDDKGKRLPGYLNKLVQAVATEQAEVMAELDQLIKRVGHMKEIVATQQSYAGNSCVLAPVQVASLLQDVMQMNEASMARHHVQVDLRVAPLPPLMLDRTRVLQIMMNLLSNAKQACGELSQQEASVVVEASAVGDRLRITVSDNGVGIAPENLTRVFAHGFTTRPGGHGFGLHSCVLAAQDMGGTLTTHSAGPGQGATFTVELPMAVVSAPA
jgi:predicted ATPase/signal transduction histidine kinase